MDDYGNTVVMRGSDIVKYAARDGALLWSRAGNPPAMAMDRQGNVVVTGAARDNNGDFGFAAKLRASDGAPLWITRHAGQGEAVAVDGVGNVVITGIIDSNTLDYYTAKFAARNGALLWEKSYNGPWGCRDWAYALVLDRGGNVVVTGYSTGAFAPNCRIINTRYQNTVKYAAMDGALLWQKPSSDHEDFVYVLDALVAPPVAVAVDAGSNVVVIGITQFGSYTEKYSANGGWASSRGGKAMTVDGLGNVIVTGSPSFSASIPDAPTTKYSGTNGTTLWEKWFKMSGSSDDQARSVAVDSGGNVIVTGASVGDGGNRDFYTAKYSNANGALLWEKRYNGPANGDDYPSSIVADSNRDVVVTGSSQGDYYTAKYGVVNGALRWEKRGPKGGATAVAMDARGNVVVTGSSNDGFYTAKYAAANGALLWEKRSDLGSAEKKAWAVAVDGNGNVVVTGFSTACCGVTPYDYYTVKYAAATGALLWEEIYPTGQYDESARAVAIDGRGDVVVMGAAHTVKYAAANGALLWEQHYLAGQPGEGARAVAFDNRGDVIVMGNVHTAKFAAASGALIWSKGGGTAMAVDGSGDVLVAATSAGDYDTVKYAGEDGALLWEKRYNGPANGNDVVSSIALGPNGMVAITGSSDSNLGSSISYDYATVVYWQHLSPVALERISAGVRLRFTGIPGRSYNIERAGDVAGPWSILAAPTAPVGGTIDYLDTNPPTGSAFYRTSEP